MTGYKPGLSENGGNHVMSNKFYGNGNEKMMISHGLNRVPYLQTSPSGCFSSLMIPEVKYSFL
jgi:hypothetical protein